MGEDNKFLARAINNMTDELVFFKLNIHLERLPIQGSQN